MIKQLIKFWPQFLIIIILLAFFSRLFFPKPSIYITPDYGRSDSWHLSIANKFYYSQELKKNRIPFWNPHIGMGYPTLAEGQTGIFFLPNLIFFRILPFLLAYNLTLVLAFITAGIGIYLFCRSLGLNKLASTYAGTIFPLGGFFIFHVQHHNLLQTASIMPWLFWITNEFINKRKVLYLLSLSIALSQQIFAGFPQLTFYSLVALFLYVFFRTFAKNKKFKLWIIFSIFVLLGLTLSAIQIIPTYEFLNYSTRDANPKSILEKFPYKPKNLLQFLDPFSLGNPKDGSYPRWEDGKWGIYWESAAYIGILPLSFALSIIIANLFHKNKYSKKVLTFAILVLFSLLLSLGASSPLHPVFSLPFFSIFRVPSRFLLVTQFFLAILAGMYVQKISKRKILTTLVLLISIGNLFYLFYNYNPIARAKDWFTVTPASRLLKTDNSKRVLSIGQSSQWNEYFELQGWKNTDYYHFARNSLDENSNLIFGVDQLGTYESLVSRRLKLYSSIIANGITNDHKEFKIASSSAKLLAAANVSNVISTQEISSEEFKKIFESEKYKDYMFKIYKNNINPQRLFMTSRFIVVNTVGELTEKFTNENFDPISEIILEKEPNQQNIILKNWKAEIISENPTKITIKTQTQGSGFLVLSDSYYPGWQVFLDGMTTEIFAANINSRAIIVPEGIHEIIFMYRPKSFVWGALMTLSSSILIILLLFNKNRIVYHID